MATLTLSLRPDELRRLAKRLQEAAHASVSSGAVTVVLDNGTSDSVVTVTAPDGKKGKV